MPRRGELTRASLLCCGLFVAEDPGIIAVHRALGEVWPGTASGIVAEVMGELAAVNVLGVPGAGLESVARSGSVSNRMSLRHAALFVASWFAGARLLGAILDSMYSIPGPGQVVAETTAMIGRIFDTLTDVRRPVGAASVAVVAAALIRYSRAVERLAATDVRPVAELP